MCGWNSLQGRLWLSGRKKDVIRSGSENVHASEVEAVVRAHPGVAAAAVVGLPDRALGEKVACMLQLSPGWGWEAAADPAQDADIPSGGASNRCLSAAAVQEHCAKAGLSRYKLPRAAWGSAEPLPANSVGKVLKHVVRERLIERLAHEGGIVTGSGGGSEGSTQSRL
mmetsp:Transcript_11081/g.31363  ORF Transcript_11081/g.31363 Transcript_11081/m.31363 type:complete len:168 (-) Transcript_11081:1516-2019(-)